MVFRPGSPRHPAQQLRRELNQLLSGFFGNAEEPWTVSGRERPAVNMWETPDALHVELEVPGVQTDQVDISVVGDQLSLRIERPDVDQQGTTYHRRERPVGSFTRVVRLPMEVDSEKVEAALRNGVLTVHLAKAEAAKPRKIHVSTSP